MRTADKERLRQMKQREESESGNKKKLYGIMRNYAELCGDMRNAAKTHKKPKKCAEMRIYLYI